jgi:hypothetical protein
MSRIWQNGGLVLKLLVFGTALGLLMATLSCQSKVVNNQAVQSPSSRSSATPTAAVQRPFIPDGNWLAGALQHVDAARSVFKLRDSTGMPMETLKVVSYPQGYLGVYHHHTAKGFVVRVATSTNLRIWHFWSQLEVNASQPTLAPVNGGGYLLAVEADNGGSTGQGRRWVRFRYYLSLQNLLLGRSARSFDAPHTLAAPGRGAEGTPNIYSVALKPDIAHSRIQVGFHYLVRGVDREARGTLVNFSTWTARKDGALDAALDRAGLHGKHGDRDAVALVANRTFTVVEAQNGSDNTWRIELFDPASGSLWPLKIKTPGGSKSFANPTIMRTTLPNGELGVVMTCYLPMPGAAAGEAGELLYFFQIPAVSG